MTAASNDFNFKRWSMMKNKKKFAKASFCVSPLTVNIRFPFMKKIITTKIAKAICSQCKFALLKKCLKIISTLNGCSTKIFSLINSDVASLTLTESVHIS